MLEPADLLILDEPTNDLDIPTLEVLEDSLAEFAGGLVLVTHDRFMLERVSNVILALDGEGGAETFADYAQWEATRAARVTAPRDPPAAPASTRARPRAKRLGYLDQREWDGMERAILDAETAVEACQRAAEDPGDRLGSGGATGPLRGAAGRTRRGGRSLRPLGRARSQAARGVAGAPGAPTSPPRSRRASGVPCCAASAGRIP